MSETTNTNIQQNSIEFTVRNYTKEQFALSWTIAYFSGDFSLGLRYMRELSQGKTEDDYALFNTEEFYEELGSDKRNIDIINKHLHAAIKDYLWDYKLFWEVVERAMRRAFDEISKTALQTNTGVDK